MDLTRLELEQEITEKSADLQAFIKSRDVLMVRVVDVRDHSVSKLMPLHEWAGTHALMNSFDVYINNIQRLVDELKALRENAPPEPPMLRLVRNEDEQSS